MPRNIAILGANGQVGRQLTRDLQQFPELRPIAVCRNEFSAGALRLAGCEVRVGSVLEEGPELVGDCDAIVNCALPGGLPDQIRALDRALERALAECSRQRQLVHLSSVAVYNPFRRGQPWRRAGTSYGRRKFRTEKALTARCRKLTILRLGHVYGPGQWMSRFVTDVAQTPGASLPFGGAQPSYAVHSQNLAAAVRHMLANPMPGVHDVYDYPMRSWQQLFAWHAQVLDLPSTPAMGAMDSLVWQARAASAYRPLFRRAGRELARQLWQAPLGYLTASPSCREILDRCLSAAPRAGWGLKLVARYRCSKAAPQSRAWCPPEYLLWQFEPQNPLSYPTTPEATASTPLLEWHQHRTRFG